MSIFAFVESEQIPADNTYVTLSAQALGTKFANPSNLPTTTRNAVDISPNGQKIATGGNSSGSVSLELYVLDERAAGGYGSRLSTANIGAVGKNSLKFHPTGKWLAVGSDSSPYLRVYPVNRSALGTKLADLAEIPASTVNGLAWSPDGKWLVCGVAGNLHIWPFDDSAGGALGTRIDYNISNVVDLSFHPSGRFLAVARNANTSIAVVYPFANGVVGTAFQPTAGEGWPPGKPDGDAGGGNGAAVAWSPDGEQLAIGITASPYILVYPFDQHGGSRYGPGRFGLKWADPGTPPTGTVNAIAWGRRLDGEVLAVAHATSPRLTVYPWLPVGGFGTKFTNPVTLPTGDCNGVAVSPLDAIIAVAHATTPFTTAYPFTSNYWMPLPTHLNVGDPVQFDIDSGSNNDPVMIRRNPDGVTVSRTHWTAVTNAIRGPYPLSPWGVGQIAYFHCGAQRFSVGQPVWVDTAANYCRLMDKDTSGVVREAGICLEAVDNSADSATAVAPVLMGPPFGFRPKADNLLPQLRIRLGYP